MRGLLWRGASGHFCESPHCKSGNRRQEGQKNTCSHICTYASTPRVSFFCVRFPDRSCCTLHYPSSCGACVGVHACLQRLVQGSSELNTSPARKLFGSCHLTLLISGISRRRCRCFFWVCRPRASQRDGSVHTPYREFLEVSEIKPHMMSQGDSTASTPRDSLGPARERTSGPPRRRRRTSPLLLFYAQISWGCILIETRPEKKERRRRTKQCVL